MARFSGACCGHPYIGDTSNYITFAQSVTNSAVQLNSNLITLDLQGNTYYVTNFAVGAEGFWNISPPRTVPVITITNGTVEIQRSFAIGAGATSTVSVVNGGKLRFLTPVNDEANIGNGYLGTLNILNGGQVEQVNAVRMFVSYLGLGGVNISGQGSVFSNRYVYFAYDHPAGVLNVLNGGQFINTGPSLINDYGGLMTVSGAGSLLKQTGSSSTFALGNYNNNPGGRLLVQSNANVVTEGQLIAGGGANTSSRITVDNATVTNLSAIWIGGEGHGTMVVTNGGRVYSQFGYYFLNSGGSDIARGVNSTSTVTVVGAGSRWDNTYNVTVGGSGYYDYTADPWNGFGNGGVGRLTVSTGAVVTAGRDIRVGSRGTVDLDGGTISAKNLTLRLAGGQLIGTGTINANVTNNGTLSPGHSVGTITITSNLTLTSTSVATFEFDSASSYDQVIVGQNFAAGGTLNLQFNYAADTNNYTFFKIFDVDAGTGGGSFSQINWSGTLPQGGYYTTFIGNDFFVVAVPEPATACLALAAAVILLRRSRNRA